MSETRIDRIASVESRVLFDGGTGSLDERMRHHRVPGVSIAVADEYRIAWAKGYGTPEASTGRSVTERSAFQAASVSKPVTALAALRLVDAGTLDLDADVNEVLRSWRVASIDGRAEPLTLRQILRHTGSVNGAWFPGYDASEAIPSITQVLRGEAPTNTSPIELDGPPGEFRYSGGGLAILQQLLTDATGESFLELMSRLILGPARMHDSWFGQPPPIEQRSRAATAHTEGGDVISGRWHVYPDLAAAGMWSTPTDLVKLALDVAASWRDDSGTLSRARAREFLTPPRPRVPRCWRRGMRSASARSWPATARAFGTATPARTRASAVHPSVTPGADAASP